MLPMTHPIMKLHQPQLTITNLLQMESVKSSSTASADSQITALTPTIKAKSNHVTSSKVWDNVVTETSVISVMTSRSAPISWNRNVREDSTVHTGTFIRAVLTLIWDSVSKGKVVSTNTLCVNFAGTICTGIAKREPNALTIIQKYLLKKISKEPKNSLNNFPRQIHSITFAITVPKLDTR